MIKVSVIIPVYNVEKYLQSCIDSCIAQTLKDIEFIFVNDASNDDSLNILLENEKRYRPVMKVINSPFNLRQGGARNLGIAIAKGEYIGFIDSDDLVLPKMFELLYEKAKITNADLCFIQNARINESVTYEEAINNIFDKPDIIWPDKTLALEGKELSDADREWLLVRSSGHIWNGLWRRNLLQRANVVFPEKLAYEDNYWSSVVIAYVNTIAFVSDVGYLYRINRESTTQSRNKKTYFDRIIIRRMLIDTVSERNLYNLLDAYEYIYTCRDTFTTFRLLAIKYDKPSYGKMKSIINDLKSAFPRWRKNKYIKSLVPIREKIENDCIYVMPDICGRILHLISRIKR